MKINIRPHRDEVIIWKEIKQLLNYLSKKNDIKFKEKLGDWEINAFPKKEGLGAEQ